MKQFPHLMLLFLLLVAAKPLSAQPLAFTQAVVLDPHVGQLGWNRPSGVSHFQLYRQMPDEEVFVLVASLPDTFYFDTLHRTLCGDTVSYYVEGLSDTATLQSPAVGLFFQDNQPTSPCSLRVCTVDTLLSQIRLSWYPSPDTDVMGYYICMGSPCRDYDTVWGRLNTTYLCSEILIDSDAHEYNFRILAFDSCFQASPLTPYYHNPHLSLSAIPCSRRLHCSWNRYINMPDSVGGYTLHYQFDGDTTWHVHHVGADGPFDFDTLISDLSISALHAYLTVDNSTDTLHALSSIIFFQFDDFDTADYLRISDLQYDDRMPSVILTIDTDPQFTGSRCFVYRAKGENGAMEQIAELARTTAMLTFTDYDISRAAGRYVYKIGVPDLCELWMTYSDTAQLLLPELQPPAAYFPNAIVYGDPDLGRFCPHFVSALSEGYSLQIFNRMGQRVFQTTQIDDCWDGKDPLGHPLPQGVYVYKSHCHHTDGTEKVYAGTVLLMK